MMFFRQALKKDKDDRGLMGKKTPSPTKQDVETPEMFLKYPSTICALCQTEITRLSEKRGMSVTHPYEGVYSQFACVRESVCESLYGILRNLES